MREFVGTCPRCLAGVEMVNTSFAECINLKCDWNTERPGMVRGEGWMLR